MIISRVKKMLIFLIFPDVSFAVQLLIEYFLVLVKVIRFVLSPNEQLVSKIDHLFGMF